MVAIQPFVGEKPASPAKYGGAEKCQACGKSVYANEKVVAAKFVYHIGCLKCAQYIATMGLPSRRRSKIIDAQIINNFFPRHAHAWAPRPVTAPL